MPDSPTDRAATKAAKKAANASRTRHADAAGRFYPADPAELAATVDALLDSVALAGRLSSGVAYVVPHAAFHYSGVTAAHAYARIRAHPHRVKRLVLIGPMHRIYGPPIHGCAVPAARRWHTPLGPVPIDTAATHTLANHAMVTVDDSPHAREHAIEVQLPFLQRLPIGQLPILPIAVGKCPASDLADLLDLAAAELTDTVVLCSTDLSHGLDLKAAHERDTHTITAITNLDPERIQPADACGDANTLRGFITWANRHSLRPQLLHRSTSPNPTSVVGYAAVRFDRGLGVDG